MQPQAGHLQQQTTAITLDPEPWMVDLLLLLSPGPANPHLPTTTRRVERALQRSARLLPLRELSAKVPQPPRPILTLTMSNSPGLVTTRMTTTSRISTLVAVEVDSM